MRLPRGNRRAASFVPSRPRFVVDVELASGAELVTRLREQGVAPDEVVFKYFWPRFAPPADSGILSLLKSENLGGQFERLIAMHRIVPSGIPLPVGMVRNTDGDLVGYVLERIEGDTFHSLLELGMVEEARRTFAVVERHMSKLHAKSIAHGDLNAYNVIASDDGRSLLIDPVPNPGPGALLQDELLLDELRKLDPGLSQGLIVTGTPGPTRSTSQRMSSLATLMHPWDAAVPRAPPTFINPWIAT